MTDVIQCETWLLNWAETSKGGAKLVLQLHAEDLEPFKSLTLAKGKTAGQRFMAVFALIGDDEQPGKLAVGPLCRLAVIWCRETAFQQWLAHVWPTMWRESELGGAPAEECSKAVICKVCDITTRKELDHSPEARRAFNDLIRRPYMDYLESYGRGEG